MHDSHHHTSRRTVALALAVALAAAACSSDDPDAAGTIVETTEATAPTSPDPTEPAPVDVASTYEAIGNPDASIVIVNTQGGPGPELSVDELDGIADLVDLARVYVVTVHQAQTIDPARFEADDISFDEAKAADVESVEMLAAVVERFVNDGRQVYVLGISFGAFMAQELLAAQGVVADGYLAMVGRLDIDEAAWSEFAEGRTVGFADGTDIVAVPTEDAGMGAETEAGDRNMARLAAGLGHHRFTERLAGLDLSSLVYVYGETDEQVGRLAADEIAFLEGAGAIVWRSDGGHDRAVDEYLAAGLAELLGDDVVEAIGESSAAPAALPETGYATGGELLTDDHVGALAVGDEVARFTDVAVEFDLDIGLPADVVPAGPAVVGATTDSLFVVPFDAASEEPTGGVAVLHGDEVLIGELESLDQDANGFLVFGATVAPLDGGPAKAVSATLGIEVGSSTFELAGTDAIVRGALGTRSLTQVEYLITNHPEVERLVLQDIEGSVNDEVNVMTVALVREAGLDTHVPADGEIYSGGVDLFAGGVERTAEPGATIGVHAWCCGPDGESAHVLEQDDPAHDDQLTLFTSLLGAVRGARFYFFTLQAAPFNGIEVMTPAELDVFDLVTADEALAAPEPLPLDAATAATVGEVVDAVAAGLRSDGRTVEVLVVVEGASPSAVLAVDSDDVDAEMVTLTLETSRSGVTLVGATAQRVVGR